MEMESKIRFFFIGVIAACIIYFCSIAERSIRSNSKVTSRIISGPYNDTLYIRGQIHYLSTESGMKASSGCWSRLVKPVLQLTCADLNSRPSLELEVAFFFTSCYCEAVGKPKLECSFDSSRGLGPDDDLIQCAQEKCFNHWGVDGFDTIYSRMHDLCYFLEYESEYHDKNLKRPMTDKQLEQLLADVIGDPGLNRPRLILLELVIASEINIRHSSIEHWISEQLEDFWYHFDNVKFLIKDVASVFLEDEEEYHS